MKLKIGGDSELHQLEAANLYAMPMLKNLYLANAVNLVSIRLVKHKCTKRSKIKFITCGCCSLHNLTHYDF